MPGAIICTVGTTLDVHNDIVDALIREIAEFAPEMVAFVVTAESRQNAERVAAGANLRPEQCEFVELGSAHDFDEVFAKMNEAISRLHASGFSSDRISINYTSGTKVMSSGTVLSAVFHQCHELRYLYAGGTRGHEQVVVTTHPVAIFAYRDLLLAHRLLEEMRFQSAIDLLNSIDRSLLTERDSTSVDALKELAHAYYCWDTFHHREALNCLRSLPPASHMVRRFVPNTEALDLLGQLANDLEQSNYTPLVFADMMNNAVRRKLKGNHDDACARIYRALEMLGQWALKRFDINTDDVDTRRVPPRHRVSYEAMRSMDDGQVKIGLRKAFDLLGILDTPLGQRFAADTEISQLLQRRALSILAHGTKPMEAAESTRLLRAARDVFAQEIEGFESLCRKLQFPWLPSVEYEG